MKRIDGKVHRFAHLIVYGCQMNQSDAERMLGQLKTIGYEPTEEMGEADLILINTCCVRETAEDRVYGKIGEIKHLKRQNPDLIFGITGCMAQKEGEALIKRAPHIDFVLGTNKVHELTRVVREIEAEHGHVVDVELGETELPDDVPVARSGKLSAWIPIMYGCNNFCTYCIVPYVRGRERSRSADAICEEIKQAVDQGYREFTLLGQNVNSYGKDRGEKDAFAALLRQVDAIPGVERVRYMTSHPRDMSEELIRTVAESKHVCKHFHIPVQSGSTRIMQAMNRGYTRESYLQLVDTIRKYVPEAVLTTDIIVGFPGETEEDFAETLSLFDTVSYDAAYTFIYSRRSGTPAATMADQVPDKVKKERLNRLMELQNRHSLKHNQKLVGRTLPVMVEGLSHNNSKMWSGRTDGNKLVLWPVGERFFNPGDVVPVTIETAQTWLLKGRAAL